MKSAPTTAPDPILLAEDEETLRRAVAREFEEAGFMVTAVADGEAALAAWRQGAFAAIVLDNRMPGRLGIEVMEEVRSEDPEIPIFLMTGDPDLDSARRAVKAQASDYVVKPFVPDELVGRVRRAVVAARLAREVARLEGRRKSYSRFLVAELFRPISNLKMLFDLALSTWAARLDSSEASVLEEGRTEVERIWKIARDLHDLDMAREGPLGWKDESFDVHEALEEARKSSAVLSRVEGRVIDVQAKTELASLVARADRSLFVRAIANLLLAAVESAPAGGSIRVEARRSPGGALEIAVHSSDSWVPPDAWRDVLAADFDEFREPGWLSPPTFLGLVLVRLLVESREGRIEVARAEPEGTRILLVLEATSP